MPADGVFAIGRGFLSAEKVKLSGGREGLGIGVGIRSVARNKNMASSSTSIETSLSSQVAIKSWSDVE